ncbi:copper resistance system multicopper oxidase [Parasphingopyxis lamellibrachiae]|uniref:CopA family copper-resistance protein n=1 Tax=Parasphingopyxis lamellibrachiae TaxID=680125 RepID=A0A3D9FHU8_9SPHN|nr:copper resistance system multicopper oxidase [Parasphingopyxis lamellibrachiae]RED16666.1 CopA family copper-resistance protein [Parasphingopyxis lamellibrachiae]
MQPIDRRTMLKTGAIGVAGLGLSSLMPAWAQTGTAGIGPEMPMLSGEDIAIEIGATPFTVGGRTGHAITMNGTLPAPLIRLREGQNVRFAVTNTLDVDSSIHWHGLLLPFDMDGVPGVSFPGIRPRETFTYEFPVIQAGTYWYHSHSGLQEAMGHYGPIVIDPADPDPVRYDREHVIVFSDWSFMHPHQIMERLKQSPDYYNRQQNTLFDGRPMTAGERAMWGGMRMMPSDIADVTGATYTYLINGHGPQENWTGLFRPGERVRLRMINASAMSIMNVRIPGLAMTVVNADGENVRPVAVDELQISVAETYDVIVTPTEDRAYTLVGESIDRSGMARATLAPRLGMEAEVPPLRERPTLTMRDMGMAGMAESGDGAVDHAAMGHDMSGDGAMEHGMRDGSLAPGVALTPGVEMIAPMPQDRTGDPGLGLGNVGHRVLTYTDLIALDPNPDPRPPSRELEIHLTGNMERYMWSFDGRRFSEQVEPFRFARDERVRVKLVNDTMMTHPIHLHGHFFEIVNGHDGHQPRKHTVNVLPGGFVRFDFTADAPGDWAFHCHLMMHMHAGMFNIVTVRPLEGEGA